MRGLFAFPDWTQGPTTFPDGTCRPTAFPDEGIGPSVPLHFQRRLGALSARSVYCSSSGPAGECGNSACSARRGQNQFGLRQSPTASQEVVVIRRGGGAESVLLAGGSAADWCHHQLWRVTAAAAAATSHRLLDNRGRLSDGRYL